MVDSADKLRQELVELRARTKPQAEWTSVQDRLEQPAIENRIRMLQNHFDRLGSELLEMEILKRSETVTEE